MDRLKALAQFLMAIAALLTAFATGIQAVKNQGCLFAVRACARTLGKELHPPPQP